MNINANNQALILRYARLALENSRQKILQPTEEMLEIEQRLALPATEIIKQASAIVINKIK